MPNDERDYTPPGRLEFARKAVDAAFGLPARPPTIATEAPEQNPPDYYFGTLAPQTGRKDDQGKARFDLLWPWFEEEVARVLTHGAAKYGDWNWSKGIDYSRLYAAMHRHIRAWWKGESIDPDTGLHHLAHACCELMFAFGMETLHPNRDDRPFTRSDYASTTQD